MSEYRELSAGEKVALHMIRELEESLGRTLATLKTLPDVDQRNLAIARTHFEDGCMRAVRAVTRPITSL
jgi:hypothetical protein